MNCEKCGKAMFVYRFNDFGVTPFRTYLGKKCVNLDCSEAHKVIEIDQTQKPKCDVVFLRAQKES